MNYCGRCGTDMQRASSLVYSARARGGATGEAPTASGRRQGDSQDDWLGRIVDGRYRVLEVIGRGGMGVVYKVEHQRMGKIAAMKVLQRDVANNPDALQRFRREAAAISRLTHPNTVQVFDFGTVSAVPYLVIWCSPS
jgi:serine/threonine-protein kinase